MADPPHRPAPGPRGPRIATLSFGYPSEEAPGRMLFTHEQAKALAAEGAEVVAIDLGAHLAPRIEVREGIEVHRVPFPTRLRSAPSTLLPAWRRGLGHLREVTGALDLALLSFLEHRYLLALPALRARRRAITVHGVDAMLSDLPPWARWGRRALLRWADRVFAVSEATAALLPTSAPVLVVPNGVNRAKLDRALELDRDELRRRLGWPSAAKVILSVANLVPRKGLDRLLAADALLMQRGIDALHVVIGRGPEGAALETQARHLGLQDRTRWIPGPLSDAQVAAAIAACDVFALASRTLRRPAGMEGFGVVYAEASYLGRPVVAGASGGVPEVVVDGVTGFLVDPEAPDAPGRFADRLETLLGDPVLAERMGRRGRERALERYDWRRNARRVLRATGLSSDRPDQG